MNTPHKSQPLPSWRFLSLSQGYALILSTHKMRLWAQRHPADLLLSQYLKFGRLTAEDGLSSDQTWELAQDKRGFMWFGTANGLQQGNWGRTTVNAW